MAGVQIEVLEQMDEPSICTFASAFASEHSVVGVLSSSDYYQSKAARVAELLGLPGGDPSTLKFARNKANQRRCLAEAGVGQPRFAILRSSSEAVESFRKFGGPVVLKPLHGTGSAGVTLARNADEVARAAHSIRASTHASIEPGSEPRLLLEEYISGREYSIECFDGHIVGVTEKHVSPPPHFVEIGHAYPAPLSRAGGERLRQIASAAVEALQLSHGPVHVEAKLQGRSAYIIEVNARLAGGFIPRLIELTGHDLISRTISRATGIPMLIPTLAAPAAAIRFLMAPAGPARITRITGLHQASFCSEIKDVCLYRRPGDLVRRHNDFRDRIGHIVATGETPVAAAAAAVRAVKRIDVETENV